MNYYKRKREVLIKQLKAKIPVLSGSIAQGFWKCNVPGCRCKKGKLHTAYTLTWKEEKKTRTLYVPIDLRKEVEEWNKEYQRIKDLIQEISEINRIIIRGYVKDKRGRRKHAQSIS